jgi:pectate lyase
MNARIVLIVLSFILSADVPAAESSKYLDAVRTFADNVLKYGRDTYGPKHTPLFVDGLNIHTREPVKWISPKGDVLTATATETEEWILSNFASQQTLLRTLDGLSNITGDPKYREVAMDATEYAFEHLRSPNGLLYWGHTTAYDAKADNICGSTNKGHDLKLDYPYYELMWQVNLEATKTYIEAFWSAHIIDWSNLDFDRVGWLEESLEEPWNHEYKGGPIFFKGKGLATITTGTSLMHAGAMLYRYSGQNQPLIWSKRLAKRYVNTRHPKTGISANIYNNPWNQILLGDDLKKHFIDPYITFFPYRLTKNSYFYWPERTDAHPWIAFFLIGEMLGESGKEFTQWALEELTAWGKVAYRKKDNSFIPMLTDGTSLEGYVFKEHTYFGPKGTSFRPYFAGLPFFWAYTTAYKTTGDEFMWQMARDIGIGNNFGDIGESPKHEAKLKVDTSCSDVFGLIGFLELYNRTNNLELFLMARHIGDNIVQNHFFKGFFVPTKKHTYTRFDSFEPLALLHLCAAMESSERSVPRIWPSSPLFIPPYRYKEKPIDRQLIYRLTELSEPPMSLQEAAAIGDIGLIRSLIEEGVDVNGREDPIFKTALHRAAIGGHKDVAELLLAKGADVNARDQFPCATPLYYAAEKGHKEIVELLIAEGADANAKNSQGQTPLDIAVRRGHKDIVELLRARVANSSIHQAASQGDMARIKYLLENGFDVNARDDDSRTALIRAVMGRHIDVVKFLIEVGADVNLSDKTGFMPLTYALLNKDSNMVQMLLDKGANVNVKANWSGYTSLHWTVMIGSRELTELILEAGADVNAKSNAGETPLDIAACRDSVAIAELLVAKGAEVSSLHVAAYVGDQTRVEAFIAKGVETDKKIGMLGNTALHSAAAGGHAEVAEFLIDKGSDVNAQNRSGQIPLHIAAQAGYLHVVRLLLDRGSEVSIQDKNGRTALSLAQKANHTEIVELLRKQGAEDLSKNHTAENKRFNDVADLVLTGETQNNCFGDHITVGDVNGDGYDDILVSAARFNDGQGRAYLYYGGANIDEIPDKIFTGGNPGDLLSGGGAHPIYLADMNKDGFDDVIIAARDFGNSKGRVYIFYGSPNMDENTDIAIEGQVSGSQFGHSIAVGDLNGDGNMDLIIGAIKYEEYKGQIYLYYGPIALDTSVDKTFTGEDTKDVFGNAMTAHGDVDADGCDDLLVGTLYWPKMKGRGRAYLFYGASGTEMDITPDLIFDAQNDGDNFVVGIDLFDIDNDGYADVLISAREWGEGANASQGRAYIY